MGFWASTVTVVGVIGCTAGLIWTGIHFGSKWIDKTLGVQPPRDPNEPLVLPHVQDR